MAYRLIEDNYQTIPLNKEKKPALRFKDIEIDKNLIDSNFYKYNSVQALGLLTRGVWCIDIDIHNSNGFISLMTSPYYDELLQNAKRTLVQKTPSGGKHIIFKKRLDIEYRQNINYLPGVDIKAHYNNFFVLGGSVTTKGIYQIANMAEPILYEGDLEEEIFCNQEQNILEKYSVFNAMPTYDFSHFKTRGQAKGLGKQAYQRIINGQSTERNNDLFLASTYAKQCGIDLSPLRVLIGDNKNGDIFTESEWIATVNSANS